jgi:hypothetical protein
VGKGAEMEEGAGWRDEHFRIWILECLKNWLHLAY